MAEKLYIPVHVRIAAEEAAKHYEIADFAEKFVFDFLQEANLVGANAEGGAVDSLVANVCSKNNPGQFLEDLEEHGKQWAQEQIIERD